MRGDWQIAGLEALRFSDNYRWTWKDADDFARWIVDILPLLSELDKKHESARKSLEQIVQRINRDHVKGTRRPPCRGARDRQRGKRQA